MVLAGCATSPATLTSPGVDRNTAIRIAEEFVRVNGLTTAPQEPKHPLYSAGGVGFVVGRSAQVEAHSCGLFDGRRTGAGRTVVFRYLKRLFSDEEEDASKPRELGMAISMNPDGGDLLAEHVPIYLESVKGCGG